MASISIGTGKRKYIPPPKGTKYCKRCQQFVPVSDFGPQKDKSDGLAFWCRPCNNKHHREAHRDRLKAHSWRRKYGITPDQYHDLFDKQSGVCAICGQPEVKMHRGALRHLSVDHDHITGTIRGLLCNACNSGLGQFRDDTDLLERAIAYLRMTRESVQNVAHPPDS